MKADIMGKLKKYSPILILLAIGGIIYYFYKQGKKAGGIIKYPNNGSGIPAGWSPRPSVIQLENAFCPNGLWGCPGTDESLIFATLNPLTDDQLAAVYNDYRNKNGEDLLGKFNDELSGDDLTRALAYFSFISGRFSASRMVENTVNDWCPPVCFNFSKN